jgi:prolyl-tRNA editing enzyme YbaK/EbsC (Cys-tRNA(Pro) deacylase)
MMMPDENVTAGGSLARVQAALTAAGLGCEIRRFPDGTRTAADAAAAVGCEVAQIAKSIIFRAMPSDRVVLVLTSGAHRVNPDKVAAGLATQLAGDTLGRADAEFVRAKTGFAIGGVAPVGHITPPLVAMDQSLQNHSILWAAAGTADTVFAISPAQLIYLTSPLIMDVAA